jgi:hypothetical protein
MHKVDNVAAISRPTVQKMWEPRRLRALWASAACYRDSAAAFNCILLLSEPHVSLLVWRTIDLNPRKVVLAYVEEDWRC